jgi:putative ABC transport system permease protein
MQPNNFMTVLLRSSGRPASLAPSIRAAIRALDPELPVAEIQSMDRVLTDSLKRPRFFSTLLGLFAGLALLLAAVGVYGVVNSSTVRRTREVGIRIALGARPEDIIRNVVSRGMLPVAAGGTIGLAGSFVAGRLLKSLLFGIPPMDPVALFGAVFLLGMTAFIACAIPARRAAKVDPLKALRYE